MHSHRPAAPVTGPNAVYACAACRLRFGSRDEAKAHYSSDLHRCNIERKVNGQPFVDEATFKAAQGTGGTGGEEGEAVAYHCKICDKTFRTVQTLSTHLQSAKHKTTKASLLMAGGPGGTAAVNAAAEAHARRSEETHTKGKIRRNPRRSEQDEGDEEEEAPPAVPQHSATSEPATQTQQPAAEEGDAADEEEVVVPIGACLFCNHVSDSVETNVEHMEQQHEFLIPLKEFVSDLTGLVQYLQRKVWGGLCLWCGAASPYLAVESIRGHMNYHAHNRIRWTDHEDEFAEWYSLPSRTGASVAARKLEELRKLEMQKMDERRSRQRERIRQQQQQLLSKHPLMIEANRAHTSVTQVILRDKQAQILRKIGKTEQPRLDRANKDWIRMHVNLHNPPAFHGY